MKGDLHTHKHISYVKDLLSESPGLIYREFVICVYLTYGVFFQAFVFDPTKKLKERQDAAAQSDRVNAVAYALAKALADQKKMDDDMLKKRSEEVRNNTGKK
jgi:hypothetical protein